jgi:hypothetical protein
MTRCTTVHGKANKMRASGYAMCKIKGQCTALCHIETKTKEKHEIYR